MSGVEGVASEARAPELAEAWAKAVQTTAKERLVMDLRGLNRDTHKWDMAYDSLLRVAGQYEPGDKLAVLDLSSAFHLIPISKSAWSLLGLRHGDKYWRCTRLPFGYSAAPAICTVFTSELARLIELWDEVKAVTSYVDDFFVILKPDTESSFLDRVASYLATMGAIVKPEKCQFGEAVTFVGYEVRGTDSGLEISMRQSKAERLKMEISALTQLVLHDRQGWLDPAVEKLGGRLQWYWPALAHSYAYMEPLHYWRQRAARGSSTEKSEAARSALYRAMTWWGEAVDKSCGRWTAISGVDYTELAVVDASGPHAEGAYSFGGILWRRERTGSWEVHAAWQGQRGIHADSTQEAELAAIMDAWQRMETAAGLVVSDSTAAVTAAARGYTRAYGSGVNSRLREAVEGHGVRHVIWSPRAYNTAADSLSRPQENR